MGAAREISRHPFRFAQNVDGGDRTALGDLLGELRQPAIDRVHSMLGPRYPADELAHDALVHAGMQLEKCRACSGGQLVSFFMVVAENRVKDYLRSPEGELDALTDSTADWLQDLPDIDSLPPEFREEHETRLRIECEELDSLPSDTREIVIFRRRPRVAASWLDHGVASQREGVCSPGS